jgi:prepilin peptidase CpaA
MMPPALYWLLCLLTVLSAIYDARSWRVPNWVTLPLLLGGIALHFPGALETWMGCLLLFSTWRLGALGGGDTKLWMAALWLGPPDLASLAVVVMAAAFLLTGSAQLLWRRLRRCPLRGLRSPGAWRVIPFSLWLLVVSG